MRDKYFLFVFVVFFLAFSSAVVFYDQGTNVVNSSGVTLENGSIEIYIYDASSGGNLVYNKNVSSGIINGSWNIKIEPDLEYGKLYYKDYVIEGDNLNFSGEDRIEFQSPFGLINNASFFNFSLIDSCPSGSSIREIYEDGSVVCETDDSGDVNLSNYALTNESEIFDKNITVVNYGFFGWLGSLANRVTSLFVVNLNTLNLTLNGTTISNWDDVNSSAINTDTQKNASGYLYNDSTTIYLNETELNSTIDLRASGLGDNSSWNESYADTKYSLISEPLWTSNFTAYNSSWSLDTDTQKNASGRYLYNDSTTIYLNETELNSTIDLRASGLGDNSSWNESYADTKYVNKSSEGDLDVNSSVYSNYTVWWGGLTSWVSGWFVNSAGQLEFNESKLNSTIDLRASGLGDNSSWNESYADTKYINKSSEGDLDVNSSVYSNSTNWWASLSSWLSGWFVNNGGQLEFNETKLNETIDLRASGLGDNSSWNESYADTKYVNKSSEGDLDVNSSVYSNFTTWWGGLTSWVSGWFVNNGGQLEFNETKLNETISIEGVNLGFNWTYNSTYDSKADYQFGNNNFNGTGNMTSSYFIGDGSLLSNIQLDSVELNSSQVMMNEFFELKDWYDSFQSAGRISGGLVSSNGDGTVAVLEGNGLIKNGSSTPTDGEYCPIENCSAISDTIYVTWGNVSSLSLTDEAYNYIYYNGSSGAIESTIDFYSVDFTRDFTLGRVYRSGNDVTVRLCGTNIWNFNRRVQLFGEERFPVERAKGMMISETGTRNIRITAGIIWAELVNRFTTNAFDSSLSTNNFTYWYQNGTSGWSEVSEVSQIDNLNWDDGTGVLNDLSNNRYGVHWVYEVHDSSVHVVYGRGDYTLAQAQISTPPSSLPGLVNSYASLVGKIIIAKSASSFAEVSSPFTETFSSSLVQNHNDLSNIQGGAAGEFYHINASQYTSLQGGITGNFTNGNCWFYYSRGIATSTNCSSF